MKYMFLIILSFLTLSFTAGAAEQWGGRGLELQVEGRTAHMRFDCALGFVESGWTYKGTMTGKIQPGYGIPQREGETPKLEDAVFTVKKYGDILNISVKTKYSTEIYNVMKETAPQLYPCL